MKRSLKIALVIVAVLLLLFGLAAAVLLLDSLRLASAQVGEVPVEVIRLTTPVSASSTEASGLAWHGDWLIILPQYPHRFRRNVRNRDGALWAIPKDEILAYLDTPEDENPGRLDPQPIPLEDNGVRSLVDGFQGFEAIAFDGDTAYLTIEAEDDDAMQGWLVKGTMLPDRAGLELDPRSLQLIQPQTGMLNQSDEAVLLYDGQVFTFYEANGARVNPEPVVHRFSTGLDPLGTLPLDNLEYRITDASAPDEEGRFWVMNFFFPGDLQLLSLGEPLAARYGRGASHRTYPAVERLVEMQVTNQGVERIDRPPVQLELNNATGRNWEGIARLDERGVLLITDKHPDTVLAFVPLPAASGD